MDGLLCAGGRAGVCRCGRAGDGQPAISARAPRNGITRSCSGSLEHYRTGVRSAIEHRRTTLGIATVLFAIAIYLTVGGPIGSEFLPHLDEGSIWVRGTLPPSEGPTASIDFTNKARLVMASFPEVTQVVSQTGRPDDGTDTAGFFNTEYFVDLKRKEEWRPVFHQNKEALIARSTSSSQSFPA